MKMKKCKFMPYWLAGYPNFEKSLENTRVLMEYCDIIEVGIPHSDPIADGSVIQNAHRVAIENGFQTGDIFTFLEQLNAQKPVVLLTYLNTILQFGVENFANSAKKNGVNAILVPDLPPEHCELIRPIFAEKNIKIIFIISTNTPLERVKYIDEISDYFIYFVCKPSITGVQNDIEAETLEFLKNIKTFVKNPIFAGFGISNKAQVEKLSLSGADGFIIGSKFVNMNSEEIRGVCVGFV